LDFDLTANLTPINNIFDIIIINSCTLTY